MSLLLAPYNNGMRLGQGFNSYTQQICIDDAVVIDPDRVDNPVTNDGFTMRELRYAIGARASEDDDYYEEEAGEEPLPLPLPLPMSQPQAIATADATTGAAPAGDNEKPPMIGPKPPTALDSVAIQLTQDVKTISKLVEDIAQLENAIEETKDSSSLETKRDALLLEKKRMRLARIKTNGAGMKSKSLRGSVRELSQRGPSQIVSYSSRFVNKISEVTDDMNISGSLSIKYGAIGGSGKGSFVDSDKFKESDLNFFISVKVINQSINIKDALVFQGLPSVDETNFRSVFGDSFISGFLEGGEFNAVVSMKVVNKDKRMAVKAEAEVAMSVGAVDIKATANVDISKSNFSSQTETTIQVGWSGGGHIKPMDKPWTIQTLMETASKFPDLVANTPQRTYAILTKYEALRSFMALKPPKLSPMYYENAAIYTNALLDAYMDYKNIYRNLGTQLFDIQAGTKKFGEWPQKPLFSTVATLSLTNDESCFEDSIKGLDLARRACRFQMIKIVREVDEVEQHPGYAADENRAEAFQSPIAFRERLPIVKNKEKLPHLKIFGDDAVFPKLIERTEKDGMSDIEVAKAESYAADRPDVGEFQRLAPMVGSPQGAIFCNLDFIKPDFSLRTVTVELNRGAVSAISVRYSNGLLAAVGTPGGERKVSLTVHAQDGEKIIACSIETGLVKGEANASARVTAVRMYTNRGPDLEGNYEDWEPPAANGEGVRGGVVFEGLTVTHFDPLLVNAHIKGFWGYGVTSSHLTSSSGIFRLAPIWGNKQDLSAAVGEPVDVDPSTIETEAEAFHLSCRERLGWTDAAAGRSGTLQHRFAKPLPVVPTVIYGFRAIEVSSTNSPRVALNLSSVSETGISLSLKSFLHPTSNLEASVMTLPNGTIPFQHGFVDASDNPGGRSAGQNASVAVTFKKPFKAPPKVLVWFTEISQPHGWRSLWTHASNVTETGLTVNIDTWCERQFEAARVAWLAWPAEFDGKTIRSEQHNTFTKGQQVSEFPWYDGSFSKDPKVFTAIDWIDIPDTQPTGSIGIYAKHEWATKDKLRWHAGVSDSTDCIKIGMCWLGVE
ncbi:hypothetical protein FNAPI_449 [Fusarium napiforme]|uniref:H-type lectin domain-containing protein n=1 Tax=Fusarium napiforme TaxID=42672 RepID=A0A8H5K976_9HYPO|nr:hypothetical protein FNAPI_449 [Fusarium napiforme]